MRERRTHSSKPGMWFDHHLYSFVASLGRVARRPWATALTVGVMSVALALPLILRGMKRGEIGKRVRVVLDKLGLASRERALPTQLSAGEQQRVGIARAIVAEPRLLVADEPTGNLDPTLSAEIMALFASLPERGTSVLIASHDLGLVKRMKRRVLVLDHGTLADDISPEDLADA